MYSLVFFSTVFKHHPYRPAKSTSLAYVQSHCKVMKAYFSLNFGCFAAQSLKSLLIATGPSANIDLKRRMRVFVLGAFFFFLKPTNSMPRWSSSSSLSVKATAPVPLLEPGMMMVLTTSSVFNAIGSGSGGRVSRSVLSVINTMGDWWNGRDKWCVVLLCPRVKMWEAIGSLTKVFLWTHIGFLWFSHFFVRITFHGDVSHFMVTSHISWWRLTFLKSFSHFWKIVTGINFKCKKIWNCGNHWTWAPENRESMVKCRFVAVTPASPASHPSNNKHSPLHPPNSTKTTKTDGPTSACCCYHTIN